MKEVTIYKDVDFLCTGSSYIEPGVCLVLSDEYKKFTFNEENSHLMDKFIKERLSFSDGDATFHVNYPDDGGVLD